MKIVNNSSVELIASMGSDLAVVNAARVSFAKESEYEQTPFVDYKKEPILDLKVADQRLINYLGTHKHWSPFAHTSLTFRIKAPIFVARQLVKHQVGGVWNEVSRRYVDDEPEFYFPLEWRGKPENAKQGSSGVLDATPMITGISIDVSNECLTAYNNMLAYGVAPEQARMVLPQNTMTEWWWTGSLMFFARVCQQRLDSHAQQETREVAEGINRLIPDKFKYSWAALLKD